MTKKIAPVTLTGGVGYEFEDYVAAWFLVHILCGEMPLEPEFGVAVSVDFQVRESGWFLDDLLITSKSATGEKRQLAVSIKRSRQVTQSGFPSDFVEAAWEQWSALNTPKNPFRHEQDLLCLVTGELADTVKTQWNEMLGQALVTSPLRLAKRLTLKSSTNKIQRKLFKSLQCPQHIAQGVEATDVGTAKILQNTRLLHFDFRSPSSKHVKDAIRMCRMSLRNSSLEEGYRLWNELVSIASRLRPRGGSVNLPQLLAKLNHHRFQEHPNYRADWDTLRDLSNDTIATIRSQLGPGITISRERLVLDISERLEKSRQLILLGETGSGKSALAKYIATGENFQLAIWLDGQHLEGRGASGAGQSLGLQYNLTEILPTAGEKKALLVLDALEKFSPQALQNAAELITVLKPEKDGARWRVLGTSQSLQWKKIQLQLFKCGLQFSQESIHQVEPPDFKSLTVVTRALPTLSRPMMQPELGKLLRNLKILDWVACAASTSSIDNEEWFGLSNIIDEVWSWWLQSDHRRYARDGVLKKIGAEETQTLSGVVSLDHLTTPDREVLVDLENLRLLNIRDGKVSFTHDLLGDWSRLQILIAVPEPRLVDALRDRAVGPRWHAAIRLYGVRTLERAPDSIPWFELLQQLDDGSDPGKLSANLVLEAIAFASNAHHLLERTWPHLSANEGALLKRLLRHFRHSATFPDSRAASLESDSIWLTSSMRVPLWPLWEPILIFLHKRADEVKKLALKPAGELCRLWLSQMPKKTQNKRPFPWRQLTAELAITLAKEVQGLQAEGTIFNGKGYEPVYEAFLYAAPELPDQVSVLALELAKRRTPGKTNQERAKEIDGRQSTEQERQLREDTDALWWIDEPYDPWPEGPVDTVDDTFRKICLTKGSLRFLMEECPNVAKELILALCIESPQSRADRSDPIQGMAYGTAWTYDEAMFFSGPFFLFLQVNAAAAIELIIQLVDFATERWREWIKLENGIDTDPEVSGKLTVDIWIDGGTRSLIGDSKVLGWYRETSAEARHVVSALMALEKWLYAQVEANEDISEDVDQILKNTRSIALIGPLLALGKKHPHLLLGCLRPIMSVWQVYKWDSEITQEDAIGLVANMSLTPWRRWGERIFNIVKDWHKMPHRKIVFLDLVTQMLLNNSELQHHFIEIRNNWQHFSESEATSAKKVSFLIERFNPSNYKLRESEDGQRVAILEQPEHMKKNSQADLGKISYSLRLVNFPFQCRKVLEIGTPLDPGEVESFWQTLEYFVSGFAEHGETVENLYNALTAGFAVLTILHQEWIETNKERVNLYERQIKRIFASEQMHKAFDSPRSLYNILHHRTLFFGLNNNAQARDMVPRLNVVKSGKRQV